MNLNTKTDFTALMFDILNPLKNKYSKECALLDLGTTAAGYPLAVSQMEAFARPLWGLIPFWSICREWERKFYRPVMESAILQT